VAALSYSSFSNHFNHEFKYSFLEYFSLRTIAKPGFLFLRPKPIFMFCLEGLSKLFMMLLCANICINVYFEKYMPPSDDGFATRRGLLDTTPDETYEIGSPLHFQEYVLLVMIAANFVFEMGQLEEARWKWSRYLNGMWNKLDLVVLGLTAGWAMCKLHPERMHFYGKALLCLTGIPASLAMLRYISVVQSSGVLIIMIFRMGFDIK
jgi:hypothetical protein